MVWDTIELNGHVFYFKKETLPHMERIRTTEAILLLVNHSDPRTDASVIQCPNHERFIIPVQDFNYLFIAFKIHDENDPDFPHSIELVDIIDIRVL